MIAATLPIIRVLRPVQWVKNTLLFLPALAAHLPLDATSLTHLLLGFLSFCAVASAGYVLNDIYDADSDRNHSYKRSRPIATGSISINRSYAIAFAALVVAAGIATLLPVRFAYVLIIYLLLSSAYSAYLKQVVILDVVLLGILYTLRLVAGSVLANVPLSRWFLAFSIFFFLSLALAKRVVELKEQADEAGARRGYLKSDATTLVSLGGAAAMAASLVFCLYITSPDVNELYYRPDLLWGGLPILVYWLSRVWLLVARGQMHDDPIVFALRDTVTLALVAVGAALLWVAS